MRVVVKPLGFVVVAAVALAGVALPRLLHRSTGLLRDTDWTFDKSDGVMASTTPLNEWGNGHGARRFVATQPGKNNWSARWTNILKDATLPTGESFAIRFRARSRTRSAFSVWLQESQPPFMASVNREFTATPDWVEYTAVGRSRGYKPGEGQLVFHLSHVAGEIDLADVRLEKVAPTEP